MIFDHSLDRGDRLEPDEDVIGPCRERRVELARQLAVRHHGNVILQLVGRIRRGCTGARRVFGRQLDGAEEGVEFAERAPGEVVEVVALADTGLVVGDIGIAAHVEQRAGSVEDRKREVAAEAVGVVDVEHGRPGRGWT